MKQLLLKSISVFHNMRPLVNSYESISDKFFSLKMSNAGLYSVQVMTAKEQSIKRLL